MNASAGKQCRHPWEELLDSGASSEPGIGVGFCPDSASSANLPLCQISQGIEYSLPIELPGLRSL
jgi:hypothetical protein